MNYVLKTKLPENKSIQLSLMSIYGISHSKSLFICKKLGFLSNFKVKEMSEYHWRNLLRVVDSLIIERNIDLGPDLKSLVKQNKKNLINLSLYRGSRLKKGLPTRGQRTHSNAQTVRRFADTTNQQRRQKKKLRVKKK